MVDAGVWGPKDSWRDQDPFQVSDAPKRLKLDEFAVSSVLKDLKSAVEFHSSPDNNKNAWALHIHAAVVFLGEVAKFKKWDHEKLPSFEAWKDGYVGKKR